MKAILSAALVVGLCGLAGAQGEKADPVGTWKCEYKIGDQKRPAMWTGLTAVPGVEPVIAADAKYWRETFARDGLPEDRSLVVRHAAEGLAAATSMQPYLDDRELAVARAALLALAEPTD